jgi:hypothetical protein
MIISESFLIEIVYKMCATDVWKSKEHNKDVDIRHRGTPTSVSNLAVPEFNEEDIQEFLRNYNCTLVFQKLERKDQPTVYESIKLVFDTQADEAKFWSKW